MSPLDYLRWYYTSGAYTKRAVLISMLLALKDKVPSTPVLGQVAYFNKQHHTWIDEQWHPLVAVKDNASTVYLPFKTPIQLQPNDFPNVKSEITTQVGNIVVNVLCVIHPFHDVIPFIEGKMTAGRIEKYIEEKLSDKGTGSIDPDSMGKYVTAVRMLMSLAELFVASATPKNVLPPPGIEEFKQQLNKKYDLTDTLHQSQYLDALIKYDEDYLQGDPSLGIMMSGKTKNKGRIKLYSSFGVEATFGTGNTTSFITQSLNGGIPTDSEKHAELYTAMRNASYSRGKLTAIGGTLAKLLGRITAEVSVTEADCGTKRYLDRYLYADSRQFIGRYIVVDNKLLEVTSEVLKQYDGKLVKMRSPGYCLSPGTTFCRTCCGEVLYASRDSVRLASQTIADSCTVLYLRAMHGLDLSSSEMTWESMVN